MVFKMFGSEREWPAVRLSGAVVQGVPDGLCVRAPTDNERVFELHAHQLLPLTRGASVIPRAESRRQ